MDEENKCQNVVEENKTNIIESDVSHRSFNNTGPEFKLIKCSLCDAPDNTMTLKDLDIENHFMDKHFKNENGIRSNTCVYCGGAVYEYFVGNEDKKTFYHDCEEYLWRKSKV